MEWNLNYFDQDLSILIEHALSVGLEPVDLVGLLDIQRQGLVEMEGYRGSDR